MEVRIVLTMLRTSFVRIRRHTVRHFLATGKLWDRGLPPDHTILPTEFLPSDKRHPQHRDAAQLAPHPNRRQRIVDKQLKKEKREGYWGRAAQDVANSSSVRAHHTMRIGQMIREGQKPTQMYKKYSGNWWRAKHLEKHMGLL